MERKGCLTEGSKETGGEVDQKTLGKIVRRVVEVARPEKIILFGSAARGEMGSHSGVDLRGCLTEEICMNLFGVGQAVDVVVTPKGVERYRDGFALVVYPALLKKQNLKKLVAAEMKAIGIYKP